MNFHLSLILESSSRLLWILESSAAVRSLPLIMLAIQILLSFTEFLTHVEQAVLTVVSKLTQYS